MLNLDVIIMEERRILSLRPIGIIHSPYHDRVQAPHQGSRREEICQVELFKEFEQGLKDIEGFSHIILIYYLHKSKGYHLLITTPWDTKLHGLFTTRSPNRPCPLGLSVVELIARKENILEVKGLDAIDGTPLLDIKPYVPSIDEKANVKVGWLEGRLKVREA
ncbi:MAG TPA: tRNA (N6-threonylcarbamoyladenosine(37)-N6)-methyltransferase TrmO [Dehalococcoidia bacterium]|nr:tRNA (N6-threonylcarbamoyladenosine(37)-N6)-methyltransferase TrmO [Dehalococcoidia bacterium]